MYARALGLRHNQERKALRGRIVESLVHAARELQVFVAPVRLHVLNHHDRILHRRALLVPDREVQVQGTRARVERVTVLRIVTASEPASTGTSSSAVL